MTLICRCLSDLEVHVGFAREPLRGKRPIAESGDFPRRAEHR